MQNTTEIKVLGTGTSKHQMVSQVLKEFLAKAGVEIPVNDYTDIDLFVKDGIESVPAVIFKDIVYPVGSNGSFNSSLREIVTTIFKTVNFGEMDKIIIPIDFSEVSINAFAYGHRLATDLNAITKAVHVFMPSAQELLESATINIDHVLLRESYLDDFVGSFNNDWGSDLMKASLIDSEFRVGFPADQILESIEENDAALTVLGTTGQSTFLRQWFGSVSTKIMDEATSPVLAIPKEATYHGIHKIVFAYEDIDQDKAVIDQLVEFADRFGAEIHLVHVETGGTPDPGFHLKELITKMYPSALIKVQTIKSKEIAKSISNYAIAHSIDLVCLSTHKKSFLEQLSDDNITQQMALKDLPLLVLKPKSQK